LPDALESVMNQTHLNWECIVVNDGSIDRTEEVALNWVRRDHRFIYLKKENGGLSSARNMGLRIARGRYIQFLDSDDVIHEEKFEIQLKLLKDHSENALSYCDYFTSTEEDLTSPFPLRYVSPMFESQNYLHELIIRWETTLSIPIHCFLFNSSFFKMMGIDFDETLSNHEDWDCWIRIFRLKPEVLFVDRKLATYRIRSGAMCYDIHAMRNGYVNAIKKRLLDSELATNEFSLLKRRYNIVRYGVNSVYSGVAMVLSPLYYTLSFTKKILRRYIVLFKDKCI